MINNDDTVNMGMTDPNRNDVLAQVKNGMHVVDTNGDDIGTVEFVQMGDPNQKYSNDYEDRHRGAGNATGIGIFDIIDLDNFDNPEVSERMEISGYVKVDASGIFTGDMYVLPRHIARVEGNDVYLDVAKNQLTQPT